MRVRGTKTIRHVEEVEVVVDALELAEIIRRLYGAPPGAILRLTSQTRSSEGEVFDLSDLEVKLGWSSTSTEEELVEYEASPTGNLDVDVAASRARSRRAPIRPMDPSDG